MKVAIIGAGLAGLACAEALRAAGHDLAVFDKARGPGGRMSTRRMATPLGEIAFDHGAQYFTVRDPAFQAVVDDWSVRGLAGRWPSARHEAWVGVPAMNAVVKDMAARHAVHYAHHVPGILRSGGSWCLMGDAAPSGGFDAVVIAVPAEQAAALIGAHDLAMARHALMARSQPCWTAMFAFADALDARDVVIRDTGVIGWAASNRTKPGRGPAEAWVVQANAPWSSAQLEAGPDDVEAVLLSELGRALGGPIPAPIASATHRWRYALSAGTGEGALWNPALRLGLCGDWLLGPRVECAWLSGTALADRIESSAAAARP